MLAPARLALLTLVLGGWERRARAMKRMGLAVTLVLAVLGLDTRAAAQSVPDAPAAQGFTLRSAERLSYFAWLGRVPNLRWTELSLDVDHPGPYGAATLREEIALDPRARFRWHVESSFGTALSEYRTSVGAELRRYLTKNAYWGVGVGRDDFTGAYALHQNESKYYVLVGVRW